MSSASTCYRAAQSGPTYSIAAVLRILVCLMIVVALPAQAISASAERVWNAAHIHVNDAGADDLPPVTQAAPALPPQAAEHFPMQRLRDIAEGRVAVEIGSNPEAEASHLLAHAQEHRAGMPHHHDNDAQDVVYVADDGGGQPAALERTAKHNHDGFTPALTVTRTELVLRTDHALMAVAPTLDVSHFSGPGERPPR